MASCITMQAVAGPKVLSRPTSRGSPFLKAQCGCQRLASKPFTSGTSPRGAMGSLHRSRRQSRRQVVTMGLFGLGGPELAVIAGVAVLIFGPSKIPGLGKEVGKAAKSFQQAAKEFENELKSNAEGTVANVESGAETAADRKAKEEERKRNQQQQQ